MSFNFSINLHALLDVDEQIVVTRAELEAICMDIFQQAIQIVKRFLDQNNIVPNSNAISEVSLSIHLQKNRIFLPHYLAPKFSLIYWKIKN